MIAEVGSVVVVDEIGGAPLWNSLDEATECSKGLFMSAPKAGKLVSSGGLRLTFGYFTLAFYGSFGSPPELIRVPTRYYFKKATL